MPAIITEEVNFSFHRTAKVIRVCDNGCSSSAKIICSFNALYVETIECCSTN